MAEEEARQLLFDELERLGYNGYLSEPTALSEIIALTQRLPLAIKWAAGLAGSCGSLEEAAARLRRGDATRREFLNFCFATMYDALSPLAREAALLCPYLGEEWNTSSVCVALDVKESEAAAAFYELKDRGIIFASSAIEENALSVLPLTSDFLSNKWHENATLRARVAKRLRDALGTSDSEGLLLKLPRAERIPLVLRRAEELVKVRDFTNAARLVRLGLQWRADSQIVFLDGRIRYESGEVLNGIALMKVAIRRAQQEGSAQARGLLFLGEALLKHGDTEGQREGLEILEDGLRLGGSLKAADAGEFVKVALDLREFRLLDRVLGRGTSEETHFEITSALLPFLDRADLMQCCGSSIMHALTTAASRDSASVDERAIFRNAVRRLTGRMTAEAASQAEG